MRSPSPKAPGQTSRVQRPTQTGSIALRRAIPAGGANKIAVGVVGPETQHDADGRQAIRVAIGLSCASPDGLLFPALLAGV